MDVQGQVLTVDMEFGGQTYTASYFLEQDIIQANIEGRLFTTVKGIGSAEETVRALLFEWVLQNAAKASAGTITLVLRWTIHTICPDTCGVAGPRLRELSGLFFCGASGTELRFRRSIGQASFAATADAHLHIVPQSLEIVDVSEAFHWPRSSVAGALFLLMAC